MINDVKFSFDEYRNILRSGKNRWRTFEEADTNRFLIMRHDVEFSLERALALGKIECEFDVNSTFNFQVYCDLYNIFSPDAKSVLQELRHMGHTVGLHLYVSHVGLGSKDDVLEELSVQRKLLECASGNAVRTFSFHRPTKWMLCQFREDHYCDMINQYGESFFEFTEMPTRIKYISDSRHVWNYGNPLEHIDSKRLQILTHPDEWSENGDEEYENFKILKEEFGEKVSKVFYKESPKNFKKYVGLI